MSYFGVKNLALIYPRILINYGAFTSMSIKVNGRMYCHVKVTYSELLSNKSKERVFYNHLPTLNIYLPHVNGLH